MPLYFHHLRTPDGPEHDETGIDHPNLEAAYLETVRTIPLLCAELMDEGRDPSGWVFEIADPSGRVLMEVPFWERMRTGAPSRPCASSARDAALRMAGDTLAARGTAAIRASRQIRAEAASTVGFVRQAVSASMEMRILSRHAARERAGGRYRPDGAEGHEV